MKVSEAQKKICPIIQHAGVVGTDQIKGETLDVNLPANIKCITNQCMAWIYTKTRTDMSDLSEEERNEISPPEHYDKELLEKDKEGYCVKLQETEEQIVGFRRGTLNDINFRKFMEGEPFEYFGSKNDFITIKKGK